MDKMKNEGRTDKALKNTAYGIGFRIIDIILAFVLRTIFIQVLSVSYLGISGLFTNILTVLSLMEGGVGAAISFSLYKPLAEKDLNKVASLMRLYRKVYTVLGIAITVVGLGFTPFLNSIINLSENIDNLYLIYWLTILSVSSTYFFSYRRSLLIADQRADLNTKNQIIFKFTRFIALALILITTRNFIFYLVADILNTLVSNIVITLQVKKRYNTVEAIKPEPLPKEEKKTIVKYMSAGFINKVGQTVVNSTDNIIISAFISTVLVGLYSNYLMIFSSLDMAIYLLFNNLTASVGNFAVEKSKEEAEKLFNKIYLANYLIVGVITVCLFCLSNPFIKIWAGESYLLGKVTVFILIVNFYITTMGNSIDNFLASQGQLYYKNRFRPLIEAAVNLAFSLLFVLALNLNIAGVFLGTTVCFLAGRIWMDPRIIYRHFFGVPFSRYVKRFVLRTLLLVLISGVCYYITGLIFKLLSVSIFTWILCGFICVIISCGIYHLIYRKNEDYIYLKSIISGKLKKLRKKS